MKYRPRRGLAGVTSSLVFLGSLALCSTQLAAQTAQSAQPSQASQVSQPSQGRQGPQGQAAAAANNPDRWEATIKKFEEDDLVNRPPQNGIVFVGSSSIVRWNLPESFPELGPKAINRGFGGSLIADSVRYADRIVTPYKPRIVVFYAGDNDIVTDETAEQIAAEFPKFVDKVHSALPQTRIIFVSIKPSIQRWAAVDKGRAANAIVKKYCESRPTLTYLDIEPQMLGADGKPRAELLVQDGLHMTPEGYKIWNAAIRPLLKLENGSF
jgi:lysophospholipase L1-like esterase